jgi:hypothetical protein
MIAVTLPTAYPRLHLPTGFRGASRGWDWSLRLHDAPDDPYGQQLS